MHEDETPRPGITDRATIVFGTDLSRAAHDAWRFAGEFALTLDEVSEIALRGRRTPGRVRALRALLEGDTEAEIVDGEPRLVAHVSALDPSLDDGLVPAYSAVVSLIECGAIGGVDTGYGAPVVIAGVHACEPQSIVGDDEWHPVVPTSRPCACAEARRASHPVHGRSHCGVTGDGYRARSTAETFRMLDSVAVGMAVESAAPRSAPLGCAHAHLRKGPHDDCPCDCDEYCPCSSFDECQESCPPKLARANALRSAMQREATALRRALVEVGDPR